MTAALPLVILGYLIGSVPFAFLVTRLAGVDLRRVGSGNVGAANALRATNLPMAALAVLLDAGKGAFVMYGTAWMGVSLEARVAAGVATVVGHVYSVWLGCKGGKGVATACGVFAVLATPATAMALLVFVVAVWRTRYVSVGSLAVAAALPPLVWALGGHAVVLWGAAAAAALIVFKHRGNIVRLRAGVERRLGEHV
jgi:glycerol-3-phosphate acyltransferase PlsY